MNLDVPASRWVVAGLVVVVVVVAVVMVVVVVQSRVRETTTLSGGLRSCCRALRSRQDRKRRLLPLLHRRHNYSGCGLGAKQPTTMAEAVCCLSLCRPHNHTPTTQS